MEHRDNGRCAADAPPGLRPFGVEPPAASQAEPLVPNADAGTYVRIADGFRHAALRAGRFGAWCQGAGERDQFGRDVRESKCVPVSRWMLGHFADVTQGEGLWDAAFPIMCSLTEGAPTKWNDAPGRTQAEVVAKLKEAAAVADALASGMSAFGRDPEEGREAKPASPAPERSEGETPND